MTRRQVFLVVLAFLGLALLVYGRSLTNDFVPFDDDILVSRNPVIRELSPRSIRKAFTMFDPELYIPLTFLTFQVEYQAGGMNPAVFHTTNLVLHTANALFVCWLTFLLTRRRFAGVVAGLLFLLHPLHAEAVAWVAGRKDVLSAFFFLASLIAYVTHVRKPRWTAYVLSLELFLLGLLSKVIVVTLPVILLLIDVWEGRGITRKSLWEKAPFFLLSIVFGVIAFLGKGADTLPKAYSLLQWILLLAGSTAFTLWKLFLPFSLSVIYPLAGPPSPGGAGYLLALVICAFLAGFVAYGWKHARRIWVGVAFFLITLAPTFFNLYKGSVTYIASDRYAYIPSIGLFLLAGLGAARLYDHLSPRSLRRGAAVLGIFVFAAFGFLSFRQSLVWKDGITLFSHALSLYPRSALALNNRANAYIRQGNVDAAIADYRAALAVEPESVRLHNNLAKAYIRKGMKDEAYAEFEKALNIDLGDAETHLALALFFFQENRIQDARDALRNAYALNPDFVERQTDPALAQLGMGPVIGE
ncbi:MAG: tetratricopeptide repeat protein [Candidatus Peribacteraceae bacterium]|jgi:hypothetical protein